MSLSLIGLVIKNISGGDLTSPGEIQWPFKDVFGNPSVNSDGTLKNDSVVDINEINSRVVVSASDDFKELVINGQLIGIESDGFTELSIVETLSKIALATVNEIDEIFSSRVSSTRLTSSQNANIFADGKPGKLDTNGLSGWNFQNEFVGEKINWYYVYNQNAETTMTLDTLTSMYALVTIYNSRAFHFSVYTKRENDGLDYSWYRSRVNYELASGVFDGIDGETVLVYYGEEPKIFPELKKVELPYSETFSNGIQAGSEEVLFASMSTDSSASAGLYNFTAHNLGYENNGQRTSLIAKIGRDFNTIDTELTDLKNFKNAVELGRFFRGYVADESEMLGLSNPINLEYVARIDTETIFKYNGSAWVDTLVEISLTGIAGIEQEVVGYSNTHYIDLDGTNDYVELTGVDADILDYTAEWSVGFEIENVSSINDSSYTTLLSRGTNEITLRKGGSNWGVYYFANGNALAQANTWYAPTSGSKVLFVCTGTHLKYYLDGYLRASTSINSNVSHNNAVGDLNLGKKITKSYWYGGVNNLMIYKGTQLGVNQTSEYFSAQDVSTMSFYDDIIDFIPLGEGAYPVVNGLKSVISGELKNGSTSDFVQR